MAMKPETQYYVLLGKFASAIHNSPILDSAVVSSVRDQDENGDTVRFGVSVNGKYFRTEYPLNTTKTEQDILDELMSLYNVTD